MDTKSVFLPFSIGVLLWLALPLQGEAEELRFAEAVVNEWVADCDAWGNDARCHSAWSTGLSSNHLIQTYSIRHRETGAPIFQGRGVYKIAENRVNGFWEDSQGAIHPVEGEIVDQTLTVIWGSPATTLGRSTYSIQDKGLSVRDYGLGENGWNQFMEVEYPNPTE
ncbi:MAG: hypothetical protein AAFX09_13720 [Pseudomonadota bacterium]